MNKYLIIMIFLTLLSPTSALVPDYEFTLYFSEDLIVNDRYVWKIETLNTTIDTGNLKQGSEVSIKIVKDVSTVPVEGTNGNPEKINYTEYFQFRIDNKLSSNEEGLMLFYDSDTFSWCDESDCSDTKVRLILQFLVPQTLILNNGTTVDLYEYNKMNYPSLYDDWEVTEDHYILEYEGEYWHGYRIIDKWTGAHLESNHYYNQTFPDGGQVYINVSYSLISVLSVPSDPKHNNTILEDTNLSIQESVNVLNGISYAQAFILLALLPTIRRIKRS